MPGHDGIESGALAIARATPVAIAIKRYALYADGRYQNRVTDMV